MDYDLELERVVSAIRKQKARTVCIQLPDGLKPRANLIADRIESSTRAKVVIWAGSCFGACDTPHGLGRLGVDLLIQWGHAPWK
jgi:2-(3-amino-3-carboxypropyl)histidine synthase